MLPPLPLATPFDIAGSDVAGSDVAGSDVTE